MVIYIFVVLSEHLTNFEMNIMSMEHPKGLLNNVTNGFFVAKMTFEKMWNDLKMAFLWGRFYAHICTIV